MAILASRQLRPASQIWIDSYTDSIGGVNPEVRWGYSQAGLLLADTSQGTRAIQYQYDALARDSVVTDVVGAWAFRYETNRGLLDTLLTPLGDTLTYAFTSRQQLRGPWIRSGANAAFSTVQTYASTGKLRESVTTAGTYPAADLTNDLTERDINLVPLYVQVEGTGPTDSLQDSLTTDGWERLIKARHFKGGSVFAVDSFAFDPARNLTPNGESRTYQAATNRLTARGDVSPEVGQLSVRG